MIRIGIIGCGKIAQVRHLPEYAANPHVELAGYYDLNTQSAQEMAAQYGGKVYDSYFDLLNDPSIDAVSICVENRSHAEITTYALYAGKHVLCEKPMAVTLAECESMVAAAERNGKHLMIGHNMRFDPAHRKAKELLDGKDCPVSELFSRCGFASKSVFYVAFRKVVGMTPLQYISQSRSPFMIQRN